MATLGEFGAVILCDDVRREISNKDILIGVYTGEIICPAFPVILPLALYLEYYPRERGEQTIFIQLTIPGHSNPAVLNLSMNIDKDGAVALPLVGLQIPFTSEGELTIAASSDQQVWTTIKRKQIVRGPVQSLPTPAITGGQPL